MARVLFAAPAFAPEWMRTLHRHPRPLALEDAADICVRSVVAHDLGALEQAGQGCLCSALSTEGGELIELLVTSGHFAVAEAEASTVGRLRRMM